MLGNGDGNGKLLNRSGSPGKNMSVLLLMLQAGLLTTACQLCTPAYESSFDCRKRGWWRVRSGDVHVALLGSR